MSSEASSSKLLMLSHTELSRPVNRALALLSRSLCARMTAIQLHLVQRDLSITGCEVRLVSRDALRPVEEVTISFPVLASDSGERR